MERIVASPVSASVCAVCACFWLYLWNRRATYESVGLSYRKVVHDRERWRILTATFAHLEIGHLLMNLFSLWSCAGIEPEIGSFEYFRITCILIAVANALELAAYHACIFVFGLGQYEFTCSVGYSAIGFAWMTIISLLKSDQAFSILGLSVPMSLAPVVSLVITQVIVQRASFIGHLGGIVAGYLVAFGLFDWITPYWLACGLVLAALAMLTGLASDGGAVASAPPRIDPTPFGGDPAAVAAGATAGEGWEGEGGAGPGGSWV